MTLRLPRITAFSFGALVAVSAAGLACGSQAKMPSAARAKPLHLTFVGADDVNGGTALHVLVRKTTKTDYPRQDYDDVVQSLSLESDPNALDWLVITPGKTQTLDVARPANAQVGVYFLFSSPGARWRHMVDEDWIEHLQFNVGRNQINELTVWAPNASSGARGGAKPR